LPPHHPLKEQPFPAIDITTTIITITEGQTPDNISYLPPGITYNHWRQRFLPWMRQMDSTSDPFEMWIVYHPWFLDSIMALLPSPSLQPPLFLLLTN
jgi:hypothetical protein